MKNRKQKLNECQSWLRKAAEAAYYERPVPEDVMGHANVKSDYERSCIQSVINKF